MTATAFGSIVRLQGRLDADAVRPVAGALADGVRLVRHFAAVCDYSAAAIDVPPTAIAAALVDCGCALDWPTALVVPADTAEGWRHYAAAQNYAGRLRAVFSDFGAAERWALEQAALRQAQIRWFGRARSRR